MPSQSIVSPFYIRGFQADKLNQTWNPLNPILLITKNVFHLSWNNPRWKAPRALFDSVSSLSIKLLNWWLPSYQFDDNFSYSLKRNYMTSATSLCRQFYNKQGKPILIYSLLIYSIISPVDTGKLHFLFWYYRLLSPFLSHIEWNRCGWQEAAHNPHVMTSAWWCKQFWLSKSSPCRDCDWTHPNMSCRAQHIKVGVKRSRRGHILWSAKWIVVCFGFWFLF